jgi:hypothetical protein
MFSLVLANFLLAFEISVSRSTLPLTCRKTVRSEETAWATQPIGRASEEGIASMLEKFLPERERMEESWEVMTSDAAGVRGWTKTNCVSVDWQLWTRLTYSCLLP